MEPTTPQPPMWAANFDERQQKQILFARIYAKQFAHGADGHNNMLIISKLAQLLDDATGISPLSVKEGE